MNKKELKYLYSERIEKYLDELHGDWPVFAISGTNGDGPDAMEEIRSKLEPLAGETPRHSNATLVRA